MTRSRTVIFVAALVTALVTARLGWWQLDRAAQKMRWAQELAQRRDEPALNADSLAREVATLAAQVHRRVVLRGQWQPEWTVYLENRPMNGRVGFYVLTPLTLEDGTSVIVQRGWQPRDVSDRTKVVEPPTPMSPVEVHGGVALSASRLFEFDNADSGRIRQNLDLQAYAQQTRLKLRPLAIVQEGDDVADGLLRDWPAPASDVHKHYGYAFQWFALCALTIGLYVWFQIIRPRRTRV